MTPVRWLTQVRQTHPANVWQSHAQRTSDLLLLPAISHYFLDLPQGQGRAEQFLAKNATLQIGTYVEILNRYAAMSCFSDARAYGRSPTGRSSTT